jgi:hypothetical protein
MNKIKSIALGISFCTSLVVAATTVNISGTVTKTGGGPLKGVKVTLASLSNFSNTTDSLGKFKLSTVGVIRMNAPDITPYQFAFRNNEIVFSSTGKLTGEIAVFAGNGQLISNITFSDLNPNAQSITLPELTPGLNIIRLTMSGMTSSCQVLRVGNELYLQHNVAGNSSTDFQLKKSGAVVSDTLIATKPDFLTKKVPITSYDTTLTIQMDSTSVDPGAIAWGKKENPTAGLKPISTFPGYSNLKANSKLPDPFLMLDGTRITSKSEWAKRRDEIQQQILNYIYGQKPMPAKGSVTGDVSTSKITVKVSESGKSCSFSVSVDMNGATAPAPAIIYYDGGMGSPLPIPKGVAKIKFDAIETTGGSGAKSGPFYTFYGSNHPAGYMAAQAWQISRIIDLLEQQPTVIDPYKIGLTGCSRNGKGALVGGILDNRVALTLPCESGIGGAICLRLVEQLGGGEWPYHSISYVRWLSEVALKDFATGNNASGDNTDRLPVDIHSAIALIAPRAICIVDNPSINNLCPKEAWVTATAGKMAFEALGVADNFAYVGAGGTHCQWRTQYDSEVNAMINKFLKGNTSSKTGSMTGGVSVDTQKYIDWKAPALSGNL